MPNAQLLSRLTPRAWLIAGGGLIAAILFMYLFLNTISAPSYTTVVSGVNPSQTGKMTSTLSQQGINYELQNGGTALAVQSNQTAKARVVLAGANLLGNAQPNLELFEKAKLGESNFQQQVTYQRAMQGQLAEAINSVQGVSGAQVELVLPSAQNQIFGENQNASSAAVLLSGTTTLPQSSVRGIAQLVASSVPGLALSKVTITDASGELLWPQPGGAGSGSGSSLQEAEQRYDQGMEASLDAMLAQTLGAGKAQVLVYANMNVNQISKESLEYAKTGVPLSQSKDIETLTGTGTGTTAPAGAANLAGTTGGAGSKSNFKHETTSTSQGVSKTVTHSTIAPGTVESQHVSVLLDHSVPAASLPAIREAVTNAAGIQTKRGDTISIGQIAFVKPTTTAAASSPLGYAKYVLLGLGSILFLFFSTRSLRKREKETIDEPVWLRELEAPMRLSELERETSPRPAPALAGVGASPGGARANAGSANGGANGAGGDGGESIRKQVEQLVDSNPDRVAQQLRTWMQEE
ncbi:MAG TPA: flagellar M-ring protein FliF C-terminal domain-containing protein [Solirubrobacteraceae bacterium]|nr:flagellar M-ring protein FliF C-terminal domain-containing protein [Solirubrobacteraceae bacterium]